MSIIKVKFDDIGGGGTSNDVIVFNEFNEPAGNFTIDIPVSGTLTLAAATYYQKAILKINGTTITANEEMTVSYLNGRYWETPVQLGDVVVLECPYELGVGMGYVSVT